MSTSVAEALGSRLASRFGTSFLGTRAQFGNPYFLVEAEAISEVIAFLKEECGFDYFAECLGVDYSKWKGERDFAHRFEVVYNLMSTTTFERAFVKIGVDDGTPVPTCKFVFLGAEYPEREIYDLLGIVFAGNEHHTRFLLPDDWIGFPLRKEVPLGGEDVLFDQGDRGPAVGDLQMPHAGESFEGNTGSENVSGR